MASIPYATPGEYWASGGAYCELAQLQAEERAERAQDFDPSIPHARRRSAA